MNECDFRMSLKEIYEQMNAVLEDPVAYGKLFDADRQDSEEKVKSLHRNRDRALKGQASSKKKIIHLYALLLERLVGLTQCQAMLQPPYAHWLLFELLLDASCLMELLSSLQGASLHRAAMEEFYGRHKERIEKRLHTTSYVFLLLARLIYAQEQGQDVLESLQDAGVDEMGALRKDYVYLVWRGKKILLEGLCFPSTNALYRVQKKASMQARPPYDFNRPALSVDKGSGSRVSVAGYLATSGSKDLYFNERLFNLKRVTLESLRDDYQTIDERIYELLCIHQSGKGSFLVTGAEMGIGKTTFLSALIEKIPNYWGIGILDTENELRAGENYPEKNIITVIENPHLSIEAGFRYLLKTSRDVMVVGEITRKEEMESLVQGSIRLNAGIGGTLHAAKASLGMDCCSNLLKNTGDVHRVTEENLASSLDLIIHLARHPQETKRIVVQEIVEVRLKEKDFSDKSLEELTKLVLLQRLDPKPYEICSLVHFDVECNDFVYTSLPSQQYWQKMMHHVDPERCVSLQKKWLP